LRSRRPGGRSRRRPAATKSRRTPPEQLKAALTRLRAQQRATAARAAAAERFSSQIVAGLTSGLIVVDGARRVSIVNPAARRILGLDEEHVPTEHVLREVPALDEVIVECLDGKAPIVRRAVTVTRAGDTMHLGVTVSPVSADSDAEETSTPGAICLFSDLTAVVALEEQLRLKEALARLGELTAGLAHELRNGLAPIHGYARLLNPEALPHPQREYIEAIRSETQALGDVVTQFLEFAKPDPLGCIAVDLRGILERAAEDVEAAQVTLTGEFGVVHADDVLLRQAFSNLFRNSVEACGAVGRATQIAVDARADTRTDALVVSVKDNGPGLPEDAIERVFQPFFTRRPGGTGLGLAIVQKIIVSHNGRVTAANHADGGAVFTLTLPTTASNAAAAQG
jgi:PAS domain S-box-containing protein